MRYVTYVPTSEDLPIYKLINKNLPKTENNVKLFIFDSMIVTTSQAQAIIKDNPNKQLIAEARKYSSSLQRNVLGKNTGEGIASYDYFENSDIKSIRTDNATSNADLFARLLHREEIIFTAKGGSNTYPGLNEAQTQKFDTTLDNIRFGMSIRRWVKEFAMKAYRVDPMAVLFIEVDAKKNIYPTYKSTDCIYDYQTTGRKLEYVCFRLKIVEVKQFLPDISDSELNGVPFSQYSNYYRFVDDATDTIYKNANGTIVEVDSQNINFKSVPAIIASDLIDFTNTQNFLSPLQQTLELAQNYFNDRSVRDVQKLYNGFAKSYEPLVTCGTCAGVGYLSGKACPGCTPPGADRGLGHKLKTKVSDSIKVPLPKAGDPNAVSLDMSKYFGYASPPIDIWNKQDTSLNDIETAINNTYWGTTSVQSTTGPTTEKHSFKETATKTLADLQPIYERLNMTANWAEATENQLCNFIGYYQFGDTMTQSGRTYGRYYILETPDELMEQYLDMKTKGAPQTTLSDSLEKYYHAVYANDPNQLAIKLKLMNVEPFVHLTTVQVQANNPARIDFFCKLYYSEWLALQKDIYLLTTQAPALIQSLIAFAMLKMPLVADLLIPPTVSISETVKNTN